MPLRTASLRSPGEPPRVFATESFIDEMAAQVRMDSVQFRLAFLKGDKRIIEALHQRPEGRMGGTLQHLTRRSFGDEA